MALLNIPAGGKAVAAGLVPVIVELVEAITYCHQSVYVSLRYIGCNMYVKIGRNGS